MTGAVQPLRLFIRFAKRQPWQEIQNGPFPVTAEQLTEARRRYQDEVSACFDPFAGIRMSPQTSAREIVRDVAPDLSDFDAGMIGLAVCAPFVRMIGDPPARS